MTEPTPQTDDLVTITYTNDANREQTVKGQVSETDDNPEGEGNEYFYAVSSTSESHALHCWVGDNQTLVFRSNPFGKPQKLTENADVEIT